MLKFEVGQRLPLPLTPPRMELCHSSTNSAFFDIIYWIKNEDDLQKSINIFTKSPLKYGVFVAKDIPFFVIDFIGKNWNFDVSTNIHKVQADKVDDWINSESNVVSMYLCDCNTGILYGMRTIGISQSAANYIRDTLEKQDETYDNANEVDAMINKVMDSYTTNDMMKKAKMYNL